MTDRSIVYEFRASLGSFRSQLIAGGASVRDFGQKLVALDAQGSKLRRGLTGIGDDAGKVGLVAGVAFGAAIKYAADFDQAMSGVQAVTHDTSEEMDQLRAAAIKAGALTKYSATEAADGITQLAKAGVSTTDILNGGLNGALSLAAAGQISVGDAAEYTATALTQFHLKGTAASHVADLLAASAGKAQGEVSDMATALNYAGLPAAALGVSIEQTVGTLALFAKNGLIGNQAGTSLRGTLLSLTSPSQLAKQEMQKLNLSVFDAKGNFIGLDGVAGQLHDRLGGLTQAERANALGRIFGNEQIQAANILYREGAKGVDAWTKKVNDAGYAQETAAIQMNNLKGDLEQLRGSFETLLIGAGEGSQGPLRGLIQGTTNAVNALNNLPGPLKTVTTDMAGLIALTGGGLWFGSKAVNAVSRMKGALADLGLQADLTKKSLRGTALAVGVGAALTFGLPDVLSSTDAVLRDFNLSRSKGATNLDELTNQLSQSNVGKYASDLGIDINKLSTDLYNNGKSGEYFNQVMADLAAKTSGAGNTLKDFISRDIPGYTNNTERASHAQENLNSILDKNVAVLGTGHAAITAQQKAVTGLTTAQRHLSHEIGISDKELEGYKKEALSATEGFLNLSAGVKKTSFSFRTWLTDMQKAAKALKDLRINSASALEKGLNPALLHSLEKMGTKGALQIQYFAHASTKDIGDANKAWAEFNRQSELFSNSYVANIVGVTTATQHMADQTGLSTKHASEGIAGLAAAYDRLPGSVQTKIGQEGVPETQAKVDALANALNLNKWEKRVLMSLIDHASPGIKNIRDLMKNLDGMQANVWANLYTIRQPRTGLNANDPNIALSGIPDTQPRHHRAEGGVLPKDGLAYGDRIPLMAAPGEFWVSNRHGQVDKNRALLDAINSGRTMVGLSRAAQPSTVAIDYDRLASALADLPRGQLYGDVHLQPHNYSEFKREMEADRRRAALGGAFTP